MSQRAQFDLHADNLGKIVSNLLSIEMGARMAIVKLDQRSANQVHTQLPQVKVGDFVEINAFTNSDDLRQVLERFNKFAPLSCRIDIDAVVNLRDSIAHGRTFGIGNMKCLRLLKFARKADNGKLLVELAQDMNESWFQLNIQLLNTTFEKVRIALDYDKKELT